MSTDKPSPPDGAKRLSTDTSDSDSYELSPGEVQQGTLLNVNPFENEYGESAILTFNFDDKDDIVDMVAKSDLKKLANAGELERGEDYWIRKKQETDEVEGTSYHPIEVAQL